MLYFVVPLRDRSTTGDWPRVCRLLERTLASAAAQTCKQIRILVLCHTEPEGIRVPSCCEFVPVPFKPPVLADDDSSELRLWKLHSDKGRKMLHGLAVARSGQGSYVMFLDADDLVSNRLAGFVAEHMGANGWYLDRGYRMDDTLPSLLYWRRSFYHECGSSHIIRSDLAPFPDRIDDTLDLSDCYVRRYVVHAYVRDALAKQGTPLEPLPFYGAVYTFNRCNIYAATHRRETLLRFAVRILIKGRWITPRLRAEFGIRRLGL
jgi:hypothetical protein